MIRAIMIWLAASIAPAHAALVGHAGEWVTRDDNGAEVCQLSTNIFTETTTNLSWCTNWAGPLPAQGQQITSDQEHWIRCGYQHRAGCQLHFKDGWRP